MSYRTQGAPHFCILLVFLVFLGSSVHPISTRPAGWSSVGDTRFPMRSRNNGAGQVKILLTELLLCLSLVAMSPGATQTPSAAEAMALEQQGKLAEAADTWRAITRLHPKDAGAFASLGVVLSREQRYDQAAKAYRAALALNPSLPGIQLNLGLAEFKQGHF